MRRRRPSTSLSEGVVKALESILEVVVPYGIDWKDVSKHLMGYNRQKAIQTIIERAQADPIMTKVKLMLVYRELDNLAKNGGI